MSALFRLAILAAVVLGCSDSPRAPEASSAPVPPSGMPSLERRSLALADADVAETYYWAMGVSEVGNIVFLASAKERPMFRVVDSTGRRLAAFGRQGDGPGEFRQPLTLEVRGDSLLIHDSGRMTSLLYTWGGRSIGESQAPVFDIPLAWIGDSMDHWQPPGLGTTLPGRSVIRRTQVGDTGGRVLIAAQDSGFQVVLASTPGGKPLSRLPYAVGPDRIYLADAYRYRIYSYDSTGHLIATFGRQLPPHRMGPRQLAQQRESILRQPKYMRGPKGEAIALPDRRGRLDTLDREITPHFNRAPLHVDAYGRLWVVGVTNDSTTVDVFVDTTFLGRVVLPCYLFRVGNPVALTGHWLLLECELPEAADLATELQLYRIVEGKSAVVRP